jgi:hypothetical protein
MMTAEQHFPSASVSSTARRRIGGVVERHFEQEKESLLSALFTPVPFYRDVLLLIFRRESPNILEAVCEIDRQIPRQVRVFHVREDEMDQLAAFQPYYPELFPLAHRLRFRSKLMAGVDLRKHVRLPATTKDILNFHLTYSLHRLRNRIILHHLATQEFKQLAHRLQHERLLWMRTALFAKGTWDVKPNTLETEFCSAFALSEIQENMASFEEGCLQIEGKCKNEQAVAVELCWLTERYAVLLRETS